MKKLRYCRLILTFILALVFSGCNSGGRIQTPPAGYTPGQSSTCAVAAVSFNLHYVPGAASFPISTNPDVINDLGSGSVSNPFWMAETEVTYELWNAVYIWATAGGHGYAFAHPGEMGDGSGDDGQHPVTTVSWRDAMVWCNALTEYYNESNETTLDCVYYSDANYSAPLKTATNHSPLSATPGSEDLPYVKAATSGNTVMADCTAKGFRLPTSMEWELAARYKGNNNSNGAIYKGGLYWTPGNYASGARANYNNASATQEVAWYSANSGNSTHPVAGTSRKNALGLYDMSGNVWEWCFDWSGDPGNSNRVTRGGSWDNFATSLQVGGVNNEVPYYANEYLGFRFVRLE